MNSLIPSTFFAPDIIVPIWPPWRHTSNSRQCSLMNRTFPFIRTFMLSASISTDVTLLTDLREAVLAVAVLSCLHSLKELLHGVIFVSSFLPTEILRSLSDLSSPTRKYVNICPFPWKVKNKKTCFFNTNVSFFVIEPFLLYQDRARKTCIQNWLCVRLGVQN